MNIPFTFNLHLCFLAQSSETSKGIHNEMPGYFRAKRLYLKRPSNWEISSMKAYRNSLTLSFPSSTFPTAVCFLWSKSKVKHESQSPRKLQIQTGVLQAQEISKVTNQHEITSTAYGYAGTLSCLGGKNPLIKTKTMKIC